MASQKSSTLRPLNVSVQVHEDAKIVAALSRKGICEIVDELFSPVLAKRKAALIAEAAKNGKVATK